MSAATAREPIEMTLYAHGDLGAGEAHFADALRGSYMTMDRRSPDSDVPKTTGLTNFGAAPNTRCAGSPYFPVWVGDVGGHITGDIVFEFDVVSATGGNVDVRIWTDMETFACNDDYRVPAARTTVEMPVGSGRVRAVMEDVDVETATNVMLQISPRVPSLTQGRILYDSKTMDASLTFRCTPLWGDTCAPYED